MNQTQIGSNPNFAALVDGADVIRRLHGEKALNDAGVNLFDVAMPPGGAFGAVLFWSVQVSDGTDHQMYAGFSVIASVNKAGAYTDNVTTLATVQAKSSTGGTISVAITVVDGVNKITIVFTPTGSLTETIYKLRYTLLNMSGQVLSVL